MPRIFDDEQRNSEPIWANPSGTHPALALDVVAKSLKWATLRRFPRLATAKVGNAGAITLILNRP